MRQYLFIILLLNVICLAAQTPHLDLRRAERDYLSKKWEKSAAAFQKNIQQPNAAFNGGNAFYRQRNFNNAIDFYHKSIESTKNPVEKSDAWFNIGNCYLQNGKLREAEEAYETSLRLIPNKADARKNLQIVKKKLNEKQPPPPESPPPPPPLQKNPQNQYLDRGQKESLPDPSGEIPKEKALKLLQDIIIPDEQKNIRAYRANTLTGRSGGVNKDW